jgi:hypothetical protein
MTAEQQLAQHRVERHPRLARQHAAHEQDHRSAALLDRPRQARRSRALRVSRPSPCPGRLTPCPPPGSVRSAAEDPRAAYS